MQGIFNRATGTTFPIGPALDRVTAPAVLLHEMIHSQQADRIDARAMAMIDGRASEKDADLRAFLDRVAARMESAGATTDPKEAAAYIVEEAVIEGRSNGYRIANSQFFAWADKALGEKVGALLRSFAMMVRSWMVRHGVVRRLTVDDLVGYAMAGLQRAASGDVAGQKGRSVGPISDDVVAGIDELHRVLTGDPIATLRTSEAPHQGKAKLREWAVRIFRDYGFYANNPKLGRVLMDERSVRDSLGHSLNPFKAVAFKAVPEVIEKGAIAHIEKRGDMDSIYISAPVVMNGTDDIVTVLVHRDVNSQRMYLHSVTTKESLLRSSQSSADAEAFKRSGTVISGGISKILRDALNYKADRFSRAETSDSSLVDKDTIDVDGVQRPTRNSNGRLIHPTEEGIRNFWRWFGDSKVVDDQGRPLVMYHGTSMDKDFSKFKVGARGAWFTSNTEVASEYAEENDSQGSPYNPDTRQHEPVNTAARVVPSYLKAENPYRLTADDARRVNVGNYAKAQRELFAEVRAKGHDSVLWNDSLNKEWVVLGGPTQIKSATGNQGTFDPNDPDIRFSRAGLDADTGGSAAWSDKRIDSLLREFGYDFDPNLTKAYAVRMRPDDFLKATTPKSERARLEEERGELDASQLAAETQSIYLTVEESDEEGVFNIKGHEGRHRMMALRDASVTSVPVVVIVRGEAIRDAAAI